MNPVPNFNSQHVVQYGNHATKRANYKSFGSHSVNYVSVSYSRDTKRWVNVGSMGYLFLAAHTYDFHPSKDIFSPQ